MKPQGTAMLLLTSIQHNLEKEIKGQQDDSCCCFKVHLLNQRLKEIYQLATSWRESKAPPTSSIFFFHFYLSLFSLCATISYPRGKSQPTLSFPAVLRASCPSLHPQGSAAFQPGWLQGKAMHEDFVLHIHPKVIKFFRSGADQAEVGAETLMACSSHGADNESLI